MGFEVQAVGLVDSGRNVICEWYLGDELERSFANPSGCIESRKLEFLPRFVREVAGDQMSTDWSWK